jgi:hypothetical protein
VPRHVARLVSPLVVVNFDYFAFTARPGDSARRVARRRLLRLCRAFGCLGTSRGSSRRSLSSTSTTSPSLRVRVPRPVARLVVDYFDYAARSGASARRAARLAACCRQLRLRRASGFLGTSRGSSCRSSSTTSPSPRVWVPRPVARLVIDYFAYAARPGASARRAARLAACCRQLQLSRASGFLDTSRGSSCRSSSTTSPSPCVWVPRPVARLVVDYFAYAARPGASARRAARHAARLAARRRLLRLRRASGCLGTSRGSSCGSSSTTPCAATSSCGHIGSTSATPCVATTCLAAALALFRVRHAPPRYRVSVASCRPFISTSFPN